MCPNPTAMCVVIRRGSVGLVCSLPLGISEPLLSKGLSDVVPLVLFADSVVLRDVRSPGASRKFLPPPIDINDGAIEPLFPIPIPDPLGIIDPLRPATLLPRRPMSGAPGKAEDLRRPDPRGRRTSKKFDSKSSSATDEVLSLR